MRVIYLTLMLRFRRFLTLQNGIRAAEKLLDHNPTALFVTTSSLTIGALRYIKEKGLGIPEDISVMAYDDPAFFSFFTPGITSIKQPIKESALLMVKNLIELINTGEKTESGIMLKPELVVRESVKKI